MSAAGLLDVSGHLSPRWHAAVPRGPSAHETDSICSAKFINRYKHLHHLLILHRSAREELLTTSEGPRQSYLLRKADEKARKLIQKNRKQSAAHQRRGRQGRGKRGGKDGVCDDYDLYLQQKLQQKEVEDKVRRRAEEHKSRLDWYYAGCPDPCYCPRCGDHVCWCCYHICGDIEVDENRDWDYYSDYLEFLDHQAHLKVGTTILRRPSYTEYVDHMAWEQECREEERRARKEAEEAREKESVVVRKWSSLYWLLVFNKALHIDELDAVETHTLRRMFHCFYRPFWCLPDINKTFDVLAEIRRAKERPQVRRFEIMRTDFLRNHGKAIVAALRPFWGSGVCLNPVPLKPHVQRRFLEACDEERGTLRPAFHGTDTMNFRSIFTRGLLIPGTAGVRVANGSAHGNGIYTAKLSAAELSLSFVRGSKKRLLVCGVVDDSVEINENDRRGQFSVTASSNSVLHVGDAIVVFNPAMIAPLFVAEVSRPLGHASTRI